MGSEKLQFLLTFSTIYADVGWMGQKKFKNGLTKKYCYKTFLLKMPNFDPKKSKEYSITESDCNDIKGF